MGRSSPSTMSRKLSRIVSSCRSLQISILFRLLAPETATQLTRRGLYFCHASLLFQLRVNHEGTFLLKCCL
jgi:hypothetical protein